MAKAASYADLKAQLAALEAKVQEAKDAEVAEVLAGIRQQCADYGLTAEDIFGRARKPGAPRGTVAAAKYRDPETGATWTGRGKPPRWIAGKDREAFAITA